MTTILLTNDDGYDSEGITALFTSLKKKADVLLVAPDRDNSAVSHSLTMSRPLRMRKHKPNIYSVDGTPADCVLLSLKKLLDEPPDLIVSGINSGPNLGDDISYSGTVSAAIEGTMYSIPSLAFSMCNRNGNYDAAAAISWDICNLAMKNGLPENTLLNINFPSTETIRGIKVTRQGRRLWQNPIQETSDPWGKTLYWIGGGTPSHDSATDTDVYAVSEGFVSITPIHLDKTNHEGVIHMKHEWQFGSLTLNR